MEKVFAEMITFQVKPDRLRDFEEMMIGLREEMAAREGCRGVRFFRRGYTFDGVEWGNAPREITRIVKCVKFFAYWGFDGADSCGKATGWLMKEKNGEISRMLIMPFEINSGYGM